MKTSNGLLHSSTQLGQDNPFLPILWEPWELTSNGTQEIINHLWRVITAYFVIFMPRFTSQNVYVQKGKYVQSSSFPTKGQRREMRFPKTKKGVYIKKHGKLQIIPWGACFRLVRFFSVKNLPVNLSVSLKVVRAQYRGEGHLTFLHEKNTLLWLLKSNKWLMLLTQMACLCLLY